MLNFKSIHHMKTTVILAAISILFFTSCRERIDMDLDNASSRIVIEGSITNENKEHEIRITRSIGYLEEGSTPAVTNATVTITGDNQTITLTHTGHGIYKTIPAMAGIVGATYQLKVVIDGKEYMASERLNPIASIDSIAIDRANVPIQPGVIWEAGKTYYNLGVYCQEPGDQVNFYVFDAFKNGELVSDTITKQFVSDDSFINGSYIYGMYAYQVEAVPGDSVSIRMYNVSQNYYDYIVGLFSAGMSGNPFSGTPSNVQGNISNNALGYFWVSCIEEKGGIAR
jgi:energy-coupling factor transporter ATP-binding protein EcfA2